MTGKNFNIDPHNAAILLGSNTAQEVIEQLRTERWAVEIDDGADRVAEAVHDLLNDAAAMGFSDASLVALESFALTLGEELFRLIRSETR